MPLPVTLPLPAAASAAAAATTAALPPLQPLSQPLFLPLPPLLLLLPLLLMLLPMLASSGCAGGQSRKHNQGRCIKSTYEFPGYSALAVALLCYPWPLKTDSQTNAQL